MVFVVDMVMVTLLLVVVCVTRYGGGVGVFVCGNEGGVDDAGVDDDSGGVVGVEVGVGVCGGVAVCV